MQGEFNADKYFLKNNIMGLIKEPKGIDFLIKSRPLTKKEAELLNKFIGEQKARRLKKYSVKQQTIGRKALSKKRTTV